MRHNIRELWMALIAIVLITIFYLFMIGQKGGIPAASGFWGHGLGIVGFVLMLMTETFYSWRKRSPRARWGRMSTWLRLHIFMGIVGPYMVLLHTSWKFNGLAGIVMLFTVIIVVSGIIGRYIYTAIPRTADGIEIEASDLATQIAAIEVSLREWETSSPTLTQNLIRTIRDNSGGAGETLFSIFGRTFTDLEYSIKLKRARRQIDVRYRIQAKELGNLLRRKRQLKRQVSSLITARRLLSLWHAVHIPIGMILFATAFVHIVGAIYYATLLK